jgi:hypothetical protein
MGEVMGHSTARQSFNMLLLTIFGAVALLLAAIDIYGLMAYSVARLFIKMVFSSCAWVGRQQRMSAMAIVNLCLVQFGELSGVLLLIHFHLLGKFTRIVAVLSQKKSLAVDFSAVRKTRLALANRHRQRSRALRMIEELTTPSKQKFGQGSFLEFRGFLRRL